VLKRRRTGKKKKEGRGRNFEATRQAGTANGVREKANGKRKKRAGGENYGYDFVAC
jgi:hypothetical protein